MFSDSKFDSDISDWNVNNVTDISYMFQFNQFNGDISGWDISKVTNMKYLLIVNSIVIFLDGMLVVTDISYIFSKVHLIMI